TLFMEIYRFFKPDSVDPEDQETWDLIRDINSNITWIGIKIPLFAQEMLQEYAQQGEGDTE
ncbi:hypothetical protein BGZ76_004027, partial [Entomortierella beljakovae]